MAIEDLFDGTCNIFHVTESSTNVGYGISSTSFTYPANPDEANIKCHFNISDDGVMTQTESANEYVCNSKLQLPYGTDVRVNDKIVDVDTGLVYFAEIPRNVRGHHTIVKVQRKGTIKGAL